MKSINEFLGIGGGGTYIGKLATKDGISNKDWNDLDTAAQEAYSILKIHAIDEFKKNIDKYSGYNSAIRALRDIINNTLEECGYKEKLSIVGERTGETIKF